MSLKTNSPAFASGAVAALAAVSMLLPASASAGGGIGGQGAIPLAKAKKVARTAVTSTPSYRSTSTRRPLRNESCGAKSKRAIECVFSKWAGNRCVMYSPPEGLCTMQFDPYKVTWVVDVRMRGAQRGKLRAKVIRTKAGPTNEAPPTRPAAGSPPPVM